MKTYLYLALTILFLVGCSVPIATSIPPTATIISSPATATSIPPTATAGLPTAVAGVGQIISTIPLDIAPLGMAVGTDTLWIWSEEAGKVTRVNTLTNQVVAVIKIGNPNLAPYGSPKDIAVDGETVWVTDPGNSAVVRIDTETNTIVERISLGYVKLSDGKHIFSPFGLALDGNTLWVSDFDLNTVVRVDTQTKKIVATIEGINHPEGIAVSPGAVWVVQHRNNSLVQIDSTTNTIVTTLSMPGKGNAGVCGMCIDWAVSSADSIWVPLSRGQGIARIDLQTSAVIAQIGLETDIRNVAIGDGAIWATGSVWGTECGGINLLARIDPRTNTMVGQMPIPCAFSVAISNGDVWVGSYSPNTLTRIQPDR